METIANVFKAVFSAIDAFFMWLPMAPLYLIAGVILGIIVWAVFYPFIILAFSIVCGIIDIFNPKGNIAKENSTDKAVEVDLDDITIEVREPESWLSKGLKIYGAYHLLGFGKDNK
jgi:hypothetical protein